jgi:hypothetical protein
MLELGIGFAPDLTVRQNIEVQGRLAGIPARRIREAEDRILEFAGLSGFRDVPLFECPSGSTVHLGFAAMMGLGADIVLADEVLAVGDPAIREACEARVRAAGESGESVLFVSHDMAAIRRICTRVAWIDRGRIVRMGPPDDVVSAYTAELLAGRLLAPLTGEGLAESCRLLDVRLLDRRAADHGGRLPRLPGARLAARRRRRRGGRAVARQAVPVPDREPADHGGAAGDVPRGAPDPRRLLQRVELSGSLPAPRDRTLGVRAVDGHGGGGAVRLRRDEPASAGLGLAELDVEPQRPDQPAPAVARVP